MSNLPSEVLQKIFFNLNWNDLKQCATVCKEWETAANLTSELKWKNECIRDFGEVYEEAYRKSRLSWEDLHKSLRLWPHVKSSKIYLHYSDLLDCEDGYIAWDPDDVKKIQVLKNGTIGYPHHLVEEGDTGSYLGRLEDSNSISYYDPETLEEIDRAEYDFEFDMYEENDDLIVLRRQDKNEGSKLCIITKANKQIHVAGGMVQYGWGDISKFYLVGNKVFFLSKDYKIWMSKLVFENGEPTIKSVHFANFDLFPELNQIQAFANINDDRVNVLTLRGNIFSVEEKRLQKLCHIKKEMDNRNEVLNILEHHGFDWSSPAVYHWICSHDIIDGDWVAITHLKKAIVHSYGRVVFIGTSRRSLHVYYNPYIKGQLKLYNRKPTLKIDLNDHVPYVGREGRSSQQQITQIDVMEIPNGHRLILLYSQRLVAIEFHNDPAKRPYEQIDNVASQPRYNAYFRIA